VNRRAPTAFALAMFAAGAAAADVNTLVPDTGASPTGQQKFNVAVQNQTTESIEFVLRPAGGAWTTYTLSPGEKGVFNCFGCAGKFEIRLSTAGTIVTYDLVTGTPYAIRINDARHIYDIYRVP
jgi:hypothetical protein